ncbi:MAG: inorganic phosphate transporter [Deltaproteobacteria bacterium]|nr:inorganic phosphate transporter [Deltaproteobacteria bacterium]
MDTVTIVLILSMIAGFLMAFSMGANDVSNAVAPAVSAGAITIKQAVLISAVLNCVGAVFLGSQVTSTIATGIVNPIVIDDKFLLMLGMLSVLLSAGLWVLIATFTGLPVSSTHSIVGSLVGLGLVLGGTDVINWWSMLAIVACWILSPLVGAAIAYVVFVHIRHTILFARQMLRGALRWVPFWIGLTIVLVMLSFFFKTPLGKSIGFGWLPAIGISLALMIVSMAVCYYIFPKIIRFKGDPNQKVDDMFRRMQIFTASYVSLSHGANDVANAIGPVAAIYMIYSQFDLAGAVEIPLWLLLLGGAGIALGTFLMGKRVMDTIGERITQINNTRGFAISFSAATTVLVASNLGMPVSTTHATVGSIVGVGLARGFAAVDFSVFGKIVLYWVLTLPIAAFSCIGVYSLLRYLLIS